MCANMDTYCEHTVMYSVGYMDRLDYVSMLSNELCYAEVVEAHHYVQQMMCGWRYYVYVGAVQSKRVQCIMCILRMYK